MQSLRRQSRGSTIGLAPGQDGQTRELAVYAAGVVQGMALVTFPAASTIFTSPQLLRSLAARPTARMFLPQAITAVAASLLGAGLGRRWGIKRVYLLGLVANLVAMVLLLAEPVRDGRTSRWPTACCCLPRPAWASASA